MVPLFLLLIWAAVLLPPLIRSRMERDPVDSVGEFRRHLRVLESATPAANTLANNAIAGLVQMPPSWAREARRAEVLRRRQRVVKTLIGCMALTLLVGLIPGLHEVLFVHLVFDVLFATYLYLLAHARKAAIDRRRAMRDEQEAIALRAVEADDAVATSL